MMGSWGAELEVLVGVGLREEREVGRREFVSTGIHV
jgi:hypothetical protein